ncbi:DUF11 domain-containing protein [Clostridium paraputrificum]|uniref:DUF11 domain-containing protein n=1 Tax=Clostridium TaxID=1485 RepID=UPI003D34F88D
MVELNVSKSADRRYVFFGISNIIKYSIVITNVGDTKATNVTVRDIMSKGAFFIPGTFTVNGCKLEVMNINKDINVGSINPGGNILVTFDVKVVVFNPPSEIVNQAIVRYCDEMGNVMVAESNELVISVIDVNVCAQKSVDRSSACIGDVISYSVFIRNNGNINIDNVVFYDDLPPSVELLPASVLVNLVPQYIDNFSGGLDLGTINAHASMIISFQVAIVSLPASGCLENIGRFEYSYTILDNGIPVTSIGDTCTNEVATRVKNMIVKC